MSAMKIEPIERLQALHIRTDSEWIAAFRQGERVLNAFTLKDFEHVPAVCPGHRPRTICCGTDSNGADRDIVECSRCGKQWETSCNFDDDMS